MSGGDYWNPLVPRPLTLADLEEAAGHLARRAPAPRRDPRRAIPSLTADGVEALTRWLSPALRGDPRSVVMAVLGVDVVEHPLLAEEPVGFLVLEDPRHPLILARSAQRVADNLARLAVEGPPAAVMRLRVLPAEEKGGG